MEHCMQSVTPCLAHKGGYRDTVLLQVLKSRYRVNHCFERWCLDLVKCGHLLIEDISLLHLHFLSNY